MVGRRDRWTHRPEHQGPDEGRDRETGRRSGKEAPQAASVRIHNADGKFQEERTYPRSADPRSSKG
jgi:hypothetical protein